MPIKAEVILLATMPSQDVRTSGASPSSRPGTTIRRIQAKISFGRLISTRRLPKSDSIERRLVLEASSSMSPWRGSRIGEVLAFFT